ncbi:MAG: hypothetical protein LC747_07120, partial [Acidobacteria bacterium]|nr:hypothetical protein [Acidobacteriota bacterium]
MQSLILNSLAAVDEPLDPGAEVARLESLLFERQVELTTLQAEMLEFKKRYAQIVGCRLAELAEVEQAIKEAEARLQVGADNAAVEDGEDGSNRDGKIRASEKLAMGSSSMRRLFWSVAKLFHPDHAADEGEARRRHQIMVEASRAYREGDAESLHTLLGDEDLQFYCTGAQAADSPEDLNARLLSLKEELRTVEFGIKRITQDGMHRIKLAAEKEAAEGRD